MKKQVFEVWRAIKGYEGYYEVSNCGRVKSVERDVVVVRNGKQHIRHYNEKTLALNLNSNNGYLVAELCKNGKLEYKSVHVLVATAFIPNPNGYTVVHHINRIKTDNRVENLMWLSREEHEKEHADEKTEFMRKIKNKTVYQYNLKGELVNIWCSTKEAAKQLGFNQGKISESCNNKYLKEGNNKYKNNIWSYMLM